MNAFLNKPVGMERLRQALAAVERRGATRAGVTQRRARAA